MRPRDLDSIQDGDHIAHTQWQGVCRRIMWFVAFPMSARVHEDELIGRFERANIAERVPLLQISRESAL
jgi:hypothetical protein